MRPLDPITLAQAMKPDLWHEQERVAHQAASPQSVEYARLETVSEARRVIEALKRYGRDWSLTTE